MPSLDGTATVFCEGAFNTPNGKTAHGLVRHTRRYRVVSVIDSKYAGGDPLGILDGRESDIALVSMEPLSAPRPPARRSRTSWSAWRRTAVACHPRGALRCGKRLSQD
jgi:hypothetical protein